MDKKHIFKICLYSIGAFTSVLFLLAIALRFNAIEKHGFEISEFSSLAIFGSAISLLAGIVSIIKLIILFVLQKKKNATNPLNLTKTEETREEEALNYLFEQEIEVRERGGNKRLTSKERRKIKILLEEDKKKNSGVFGYSVLIFVVLFNLYFSCWAIFPDRICYHNYSYNLMVNEPREDGEIKNYRFYNGYNFTPYFIYIDGENEFKVELQSKKKGDDYTEYYFKTEEKYAKILDCALDRYTYLTVEFTAKYYHLDGHIEVSHRAVKTRVGVEVVYEKTGKIYSYKNLAN